MNKDIKFSAKEEDKGLTIPPQRDRGNNGGSAGSTIPPTRT